MHTNISGLSHLAYGDIFVWLKSRNISCLWFLFNQRILLGQFYFLYVLGIYWKSKIMNSKDVLRILSIMDRGIALLTLALSRSFILTANMCVREEKAKRFFLKKIK